MPYYGTILGGSWIPLSPENVQRDLEEHPHLWIIIAASDPFVPNQNLTNAPSFEVIHFPPYPALESEELQQAWHRYLEILAGHPHNLSSVPFVTRGVRVGDSPPTPPTSKKVKNTFSAFIRKTMSTA
jgi:hypothetical protein